ncbi:MAG: 3'-5' exonuclease [Betaproteobacteria bacterium]|nr:MAG: 3'-5' exonuclease [Betaproteobacteria bacterium]PZO25350.1 MAG: 3'-5' exonuclease [Betaproteobacteria bacterium]
MDTQQEEITSIPNANVLVIDLEATCSNDESITGSNMEIIEIGACWVNPKGEILDTFQSFVRPVLNRILTPFCTQLTTIAQDEVDGAPTFDQVAPLLQEFAVKHYEENSIWTSWGNYDRSQFEYDSARHGVENPVAHLPHANLKKIFAKKRKIKRVGMMGALQIAGIEHTGEHHRALDDAINISKLLKVAL